MFSEIKEKLKTFIVYTLTPVSFLIAYILFLINKNDKLLQENRSKDYELKDVERKHEQEKVDEEINNAVSDYDLIKQRYFSERKTPDSEV